MNGVSSVAPEGSFPRSSDADSLAPTMAAKTATRKTTAKKKAIAKPRTVAKGKAGPAAGAKGAKVAKKVVAARKPKAVRVTLGSLSEQVATLAAEVSTMSAALASLVAHLSSTSPALADAQLVAPPVADVDYESFETDLLATMGVLDRSGRHAGLIPVPELRIAFLERGWVRAAFDERLLQAERDFIVDLKVADDPLTLANPDLAIQERGRGYLQYAVAR